MNPTPRTVLWHPADGSAPVNFTDPANGRRVLTGTTGLGMTGYRHAERRIPGQAGTRHLGVSADPRDIDLELLIQADGEYELRERLQDLIRSMRPWAGEGRLEVVQPDGSTRWVCCRYMDGLEGSQAHNATLPGRWWRGTIGLHATQPYAVGPNISVTWPLQPSGVTWFPIIPIRLAPAGLGGRRTVHNPGDAEATYPLIKVQGPGLGLIVRNRTTGKAAHLNYTIPGEGLSSVVAIDTRRGAQSVTDGAGRNLFEFITDEDPSLWSMRPGDNRIEVRLLSAAATSSVTVSFDPLYESL